MAPLCDDKQARSDAAAAPSMLLLMPAADSGAVQFDAVADPPEDSRSLVLVLFACLGAGCLLPWNALITGIDYFNAIYDNARIGFDFSASYIPAVLVASFVALRLGERGGRPSAKIAGGYAVMLVALLLFAAVAKPSYGLSLFLRQVLLLYITLALRQVLLL